MGLDEQTFAVALNDIDLCLKIGQKGYRVLYTPHALLYHHEAFSKTAEDLIPHPDEVRAMQCEWKAVIAADPFYSPNLTRTAENCSTAQKSVTSGASLSTPVEYCKESSPTPFVASLLASTNLIENPHSGIGGGPGGYADDGTSRWQNAGPRRLCWRPAAADQVRGTCHPLKYFAATRFVLTCCDF